MKFFLVGQYTSIIHKEEKNNQSKFNCATVQGPNKWVGGLETSHAR